MGIEYETEDPETAKRKRDEAAPFAPVRLYLSLFAPFF